ncbi:hypothetical protein, partial [Ruegeria sp. HKCCD7255]|uniref:hypothetical protein n=1 Tax=Ruegeria sp. HKCCD7255 TaxID=2683004 RepID=UPI001C2C6460
MHHLLKQISMVCAKLSALGHCPVIRPKGSDDGLEPLAELNLTILRRSAAKDRVELILWKNNLLLAQKEGRRAERE